jgi:predicted RNA polymerase sigma factor
VALLEIQSSRLSARVDAQGQPVLLMDQDRRRWDSLLIHRGLAALTRAQARTQTPGEPGPYTVQAAIAACHARAAQPQDTDWPAIVGHYEQLLAVAPSPVVELNHAMALSMAPPPQGGPVLALRRVEALIAEGALAVYPWLYSVQGDVLERLGRPGEAVLAFERAARLSGNEGDRAVLTARAQRAASR